jgi:uncharacterized membrane protein
MKKDKQEFSQGELSAEKNHSRIYYDTYKRRFDTQRTSIEKVADKLVSSFGTLFFLVINLVWFAAWIILNLGLISAVEPFDPFPFGLLTMIVSLEAIVLSIIVLISQNRESKISNLRSEIDTRIDILAEEEITKVLEIVIEIAKKNGIQIKKDKRLQKLLQPMNRAYLEKKFKGQV